MSANCSHVMWATYMTYHFGKAFMYLAFIERLNVAYVGSAFENPIIVRSLYLMALIYLLWIPFGDSLYVDGKFEYGNLQKPNPYFYISFSWCFSVFFSFFFVTSFSFFLFKQKKNKKD